MGNLWGTVSRETRLVRFQNCSGSHKKMTMAAGLLEFKAIARRKFGFHEQDKLSVLETATGFEVEDDEVFFQLDPDIPLTVVNLRRGEMWTRPPDLLWVLFVRLLRDLWHRSHPLSLQPPYHQAAGRDARGGSTNITIVNNTHAQLVQMGDHNQAVMSGVPGGITQDEDEEH